MLWVPVGDAVVVLDSRALAVNVGLEVAVFVLNAEELVVLVIRTVREAAAEAVTVFELVDELVIPGEFELDLD